MIKIVPVYGGRKLRQFINFPVKLYKNSKQFTPYIFEDEISNLTPSKNPASAWCDFKLFLAYRDRKIVGRICGIISHYANKKYDQKRVRFNRIDMIDDIEVTKALIKAVEEWGYSRGMNEIVGPLGYSDQDKEGLLVEGFEYSNMFATFYHFPYYKKHLEELGFVSDAVWVEHRIIIPKEIDERFERVSEMVKRKYNVKVRRLKSKRQIQPYVRKALALTNRAYDHLYGYVPMSEKLMDMLARQYVPLINLKYLILVVDEKDELLAFGLSIPSPVFALKKIKGKLFPFGFIRFLRALKKSKQLDLLLVAVEPELQNSGLANVIMYESMKSAIADGIEYAETGPQLEYNKPVQRLWKDLNYFNHKRRICYVKPITEVEGEE